SSYEPRNAARSREAGKLRARCAPRQAVAREAGPARNTAARSVRRCRRGRERGTRRNASGGGRGGALAGFGAAPLRRGVGGLAGAGRRLADARRNRVFGSREL